jgi:DnaK suppressor protein
MNERRAALDGKAPPSNVYDGRSREQSLDMVNISAGLIVSGRSFYVSFVFTDRLICMSGQIRLGLAFVQFKRQQLLKLRSEIQRISDAAEAEETLIRGDAIREAREFEEDAEALDLLEKQGLLVHRSVERLALIERALAKIENGTYGYSDESGERIPDERLELMPEAVNTLREQEIAEREAR